MGVGGVPGAATVPLCRGVAWRWACAHPVGERNRDSASTQGRCVLSSAAQMGLPARRRMLDGASGLFAANHKLNDPLAAGI